MNRTPSLNGKAGGQSRSHLFCVDASSVALTVGMGSISTTDCQQRAIHLRKSATENATVPNMTPTPNVLMLRPGVLFVLLSNAFSFSPSTFTITRQAQWNSPLTTSSLFMVDVTVTSPSQDEAEALGIRKWPQAKSKGSFQESCRDGQSLVRYVLDGQGSVQISYGEESKDLSVSPGSLLEVKGEANLNWSISSREMIILTPGFEEVGRFAGVAVALVVLLGALVSIS